MSTQQKQRAAEKAAKKRWQKVPFIANLREKRTGQYTTGCIQAKSQEEAEFIAQQTWGFHFQVLDVKPT